MSKLQFYKYLSFVRYHRLSLFNF